jgi:murein DD-endopeptidase MepM/ murein hydrolase activator NlpD
MRRPGPTLIRVGGAASAGFVAGAISTAVVVWGFPTVNDLSSVTDSRGPRVFESRGSPLASPAPVGKPPRPLPATPIIDANPVAELRDRRLELPLRGALRRELRGSFDETRGSTQKHEAIDIVAPRHTPILAVEEGTIARLFQSQAGGTTVYQFDPTTWYVYYYAHLERYAEGLEEGQQVQRGQVLGYVGTSGNAPPEAPHLHFAIFRLTEQKRWWQGQPIDPYEVLNGVVSR